MSKDKDKVKSNVTIVDFKAAAEEQKKLPKMILDRIELFAQKAREGKVKSVIFAADWDTEEDDVNQDDGVVCLWNESMNVRELVGGTAYLQRLAEDVMMLGYEETFEDDD